jgi:hypothetical protein
LIQPNELRKLKSMSLRKSRRKEPSTPRPPALPVRRTGEAVHEFASASPIREAFWARASAVLKQIAEHADEQSLQRAVAAPTDAGAVARAISDSAAMTSAVAELDPLAALIAKGATQKLELLKQAGGVLSVSDVARLLRISRQAVDKRRREGKLLAVPRGADYAYPACQFDEDRVVPGLTELLGHIGPEPTWAALAFLITPDDRLEDLTPLAVLRGKDEKLKELTLRLARAVAGDGFD